MPQILRPARIADVVDGVKLRAQLTAAALDHIGDESAARTRALDLLHGALFRGRMIAKERLEAGAGGHETARLLARVADEVIAALYDFTTTHVFRSRNPTQGERFSVVAVGGYGRGQLAPSSDIDLLFLRAYKQTAWSESVTEYMLYALWDMSLKIGHATRTVDECLRLARADHTIQTALLEARHICGDPALTEELARRYRKEVAVPGHRAFVAAKLAERDARHARSGASPYMVEPNVKEGRGGLRDLHTLFWILKHRFGFVDPRDYARLDLVSSQEVSAFLRASEFLWRVRCHLHYLTGRAEERITFDLQPEMAARLGFGNRGDQPGVERFMKRYFLAAKEVGSLTRLLTAKIQAVGAGQPRKPLEALLGPKSAKAIAPGFVIEPSGQLGADPAALDRDPVQLLRLFQLAAERQLEIHPETLGHVARRLRKMTPALRSDPAAAAAFLGALAARQPARILWPMNEAGLLGRYLPEFGQIVALMQFNMYHHYTVDEHTLRAVEVMGDIEAGKLKADHPLATEIFHKVVHRRALYLAMLLHDTGKGQGDQQIEGAKTARAACTRLGLPEAEVELVAWLVANHLAMSDVAQKRDIGDPRTVARFAELVGDVERLRLLLILTVADIRAVGPGVWNSWKGQLLRDLYRLTEAAPHGGRSSEAAVKERLIAQAAEARAGLIAALGPARTDRLAAWIESLEEPYWLSFDADALAWHASEAEAAADIPGPHVAARAALERGVSEILVLAEDRPGLFAALAAAFVHAGVDVTDARAHTTRNGKAFDVFSVQTAQGGPFLEQDAAALKRLVQRVRLAADGAGPAASASRPPGPRRAAAFAIAPWVRVDNGLSDTATVIEVSGRDRPGLLADLARVLSDAGLTIVSAHVGAYGERVADVFYVQDAAGAKLTSVRRIDAIEEHLLAALMEGEPGAPADPRKRPLAVARASDGR